MLKLIFLSVAFSYLLFSPLTCVQQTIPSETIKLKTRQQSGAIFKNFLGINGFEWDFFDDKSDRINPQKVKVMQSFGGFRHYMDWERIEPEKGRYTFNPTHSGGFNYDKVYEICAANHIDVLSCLKNCPPWLISTYPHELRDVDNVPAPFGSNHYVPASYILQAKAAFQFAARYGNNKKIDRKLISVYQQPRWKDDPVNTIKTGLGLVHYIECDNERDKDWKGAKGHQSPEEYAANLSAFYDGHKGSLGKDVGVKSADPTMKVVMAGLAFPNPDYVIRMIQWCKKNRGYLPDGKINLCFDVINYHFYANDATPAHDQRTVGKAPELSEAGKVADDFMAVSKKHAGQLEVWVTESGYDINPESPQRAIPIKHKTALITQADWMLRSALLYARHGLERSFFYMLDDVNVNDATPYASAGFADQNKRRPVADYFYQVKNLIGPYHYEQTINKDPLIDVYRKDKKRMYVLYIPDERGREKLFKLNLKGAKAVKVHLLVPGANQMKTIIVSTPSGKIKLRITETPIFVEII
ncbi:beta-galactosidase [Pedobacter cryoconitis]|uniref:Glycoside hydrolase family 42 N-terminal domain-containing protein n=1 Tax=Pedobacter cryoconitis TaxID=188932 RepID=A0A7X0IZ27_9SPHI|nr:beta-galactosidase [Pedobacter cryoconitis]MBB6498089.1 hypothetical protein [Pedobacter cryoconitis]